MNIEDLFRNNLSKDEVEVSDALWKRLDSNLDSNIAQNNIPQQQTGTSLLEGVKSASALTKIVAGIAGTVIVGTAVYFAIDQDESPKEQILQTNPIVEVAKPSEPIEESEQPSFEPIEPIEEPLPLTIDTMKQELEEVAPILESEKPILESEKPILESVTPKPSFVKAESRVVEPSVLKEETAMPKEEVVVATEPESSEKIIVEKEKSKIKVKIPTAMTPNGDGINDSFVIYNLENYPDNQIVILDRRGRVLLNTSNYRNDWMAEGLPGGVYIYRIRINYGPECKIYTGELTIIR